MKDDSQDELLAEILSDSSLERLRAQTLQRGLATLRRRRRVRQFALPLAAAAVATAFFVLVRTGPAVTAENSPQVAVQSPPAESPRRGGAVQMISDDELLALFSAESVALVGEPGRQKLLFLQSETSGAHD